MGQGGFGRLEMNTLILIKRKCLPLQEFIDSNGIQGFEDVSIPLKDTGGIGKLSAGLPVNSKVFREVNASYDYYFKRVP